MNWTKKAIIDVFWQLLEEKPYSKITVQNIVEHCQINRNTFYYQLANRKTAFIYHSANRESLMRYLNEISQHIVQILHRQCNQRGGRSYRGSADANPLL